MSLQFSKAHYVNKTLERIKSQMAVLENTTPSLSIAEAHCLSGKAYNEYLSSVGTLKELKEEAQVLEEILVDLGYYGQ